MICYMYSQAIVDNIRYTNSYRLKQGVFYLQNII